jgi:hypothetical protein
MKVEDFGIWELEKSNGNCLFVKFNKPNGYVVEIACNSSTDRGCEMVNDIGINSSEASIKKRLGKSSQETIEGLVKKIEYKKFNLEFYLEKEKVYFIIVKKYD